MARTNDSLLKAYYALPCTATPQDFLAGHGNCGLTESEYRKATKLAHQIVNNTNKGRIKNTSWKEIAKGNPMMEVVGTGGSCEAYQITFSDKSFMWLTDLSGCQCPTDDKATQCGFFNNDTAEGIDGDLTEWDMKGTPVIQFATMVERIKAYCERHSVTIVHHSQQTISNLFKLNLE